MAKKDILPLLLIFAAACTFQLIFVFTTPFFSSTDSYMHLRIAEDLKESIIPKFYDPLSYGGRELSYSPIFYYIFLIFSFMFNSEIAAKIFSTLLVCSMVFPVYLISKKLTANKNISLLTSFLSAIIPANLALTFNTFTPYCLMIPLILFAIYFIMDDNKYTAHFIYISVIGAFIHPSFILLIIAFVLYLILIKISGFEISKGKIEMMLFSTLMAFWVLFIVYKNAILLNGISIIWQNTPETMLRHYFSGMSIFHIIYEIGLVPLLAGIFVIYKYTSHKLNKDIYILVSFVFSTALLMVLHLLKPSIGLAFSGIIITILFSVFLSDIWKYLANARFGIIRIALLSAILIALVFTNLVPSVVYAHKSAEESDISDKAEALKWLSENSNPSDVVVSSMNEGHLVTFFAKRPNFIDENFIGQQDASIRLEDADTIYKTSYSTEAIPLLNKYDAKYILFSPETASLYNIDGLKFLNENCFETVYDKDVKIYKSLCRMDYS
jgi:hypothetical protein